MLFIYDEIVDVTEYMPCRDSLVPTGFAYFYTCYILYMYAILMSRMANRLPTVVYSFSNQLAK